MTQRTNRSPVTRLSAFLSTVGLGTFSTLSILVIAPTPPAQANEASYPDQFSSIFLESCKNSAAANAEQLGANSEQVDNYCNCSLQTLQRRYTFEEVRSGSVDIMDIACDCAKASGINMGVSQCSQ